MLIYSSACRDCRHRIDFVTAPNFFTTVKTVLWLFSLFACFFVAVIGELCLVNCSAFIFTNSQLSTCE